MDSIALDSLFDVAQEALAVRHEQLEDKVKRFVLPHLALQSKIMPAKDEKIPENVSYRNYRLVSTTHLKLDL